ncbi:MAG TPA: TolC family protein, partial [Vicinamibacterales bacterium]|nr:TolC family protein [Vicinamibacterales bacterium]
MLALAIWLAAAPLGAQPATVGPAERPLSLEEALELAEARSEQLAAARAGVVRARGEEQRAASERWPLVTLAASYDRTLASEFEGLFDRPSAEPADGVDFGRLPFGRENIWRINLSVSQPLYTAGRIAAGRAAARAGRAGAEIAMASARAQVLLDVIRAYFDAALADRLVAIAEGAYRQADAAFRQTQLGRQAGTQPEFELLRAQVARDTQRPAVIRRRAEREIAYFRLKQLLDLPAGEPLRLTTELDGAREAPVRIAPTAASTAPPVAPPRAPVRQAEQALRASEATVAAARAERLPAVTLSTFYGRVNYPSGVLPELADFRTNWTVGVNVQLPIFTGGRLKAAEAIARAQVDEARARLQQARELAALDTLAAHEELEAARAAWEASAGTVQQAARAYEIAELRYRQGISTQLELADARLLLEQAQVNRAVAARDLQIARARVAL